MAEISIKKASASLSGTVQEWAARLIRLGPNLRQPRILFVFVLAVAVCFALASFTEQRWDMYLWRLEQALVYNNHINPFWPQSGVPLELAWSYSPLWLLTLLAIYPFYLVFYSPQLPTSIAVLWRKLLEIGNLFEIYRSLVPVGFPMLDVMDRGLIIIGDLLIALVLYKQLKRDLPKHAYYAFATWLFNPCVVWISSVWDMFDAIPALSVLLSAFLMSARAQFVTVIRKGYVTCGSPL